ncbi:MAG: 3-deoxy-7-phosphoheptulonate synthase, partial [Chloroflexota bacterium]
MTNTTPISLSKNLTIGGTDILLLAGPCSVESYEQTYAVAKSMNALGLRVLRGGAFKPRTSPNAFQGLGLEGLK